MKTAILVIDVQKLYTDIETDYTVENATTILENINEIIKSGDKNDSEIIYIRHIHSKDGSDAGRMFDFNGEEGEIEFIEGTEEVEYSKQLLILPDKIHITKRRYNSFIGTNLLEILKSKNVQKIIIVGFMSNFCCESAARYAHDLDFFVDFVKDATGTPGTELLSPTETIEATCATLGAGFANIVMTKDII